MCDINKLALPLYNNYNYLHVFNKYFIINLLNIYLYIVAQYVCENHGTFFTGIVDE